jgi:amino acid transporter
MRFKLVIIASLLAAIVGAGASIAIIVTTFSSLRPLSQPGLLVTATFLLPALSSFFASFFVYRHTARRRKLQAFLTALLSIFLCIAAFITASIITTRYKPIEPPPEQRHIALY